MDAQGAEGYPNGAAGALPEPPGEQALAEALQAAVAVQDVHALTTQPLPVVAFHDAMAVDPTQAGCLGAQARCP